MLRLHTAVCFDRVIHKQYALTWFAPQSKMNEINHDGEMYIYTTLRS